MGKKFEWTAKQYRAYRSVLSGVKLSFFGNRKVRFMSLTTSSVMAESDGYGPGVLNKHFQIFKQRILRTTPYLLYKNGYISKEELSYYYNHSEINKPLVFDYFKIETNEGNGVLHIVYRGSYLPYDYVVDNWQDIHNSWDVNIQLVKGDDSRQVSAYVVTQYVAGQGSSYVRSSQSSDWVFPGYVKKWRSFKCAYPRSYRELWDRYLKNYSVGKFLTTLDSFG